MDSDKKSDLIPLTGLWRNTSASGKTYYKGSLGGANILIFANEKKETEQQPDLRMFIAPKPPKKDEAGGPPVVQADVMPF